MRQSPSEDILGTKQTIRSLAAIAAVGLALTACGSSNSSSPTASDTGGAGANCGKNLAFLGAATGPAGALGQNMIGGIKYALDKYNTDNPDCKISLKVFDSQGDATKATPLATQIVNDSSIVGLIGPGFSTESLATGKTFAAAGLPSISPSATNVTITQQGWTTWHRVIGNDAAQGAAVAKYLQDTAKSQKPFVIDDGSDYGKGLAESVKKGLGSSYDSANTDTIQTGQTDFSATVTKVTSSGADAVFFAGYYPEGGLLVKQLRQAGYKGLFMSGDGSEDPAFIKTAGAAAAEGAILTAPAGPAPASFNTGYKKVVGSDAGLYSTQAYDATNIFLAAFKAGKESAADINSFIGSYTGTGESGPIAFDDKGDITQSTIYAYKVSNGKIDTENPTPIK
jgi:branched-chain amino acid transport system substrate-binding protein